jgi:mannose-6-phosphate isomerase-like protein (cupin superfamily)
VRRAYRLSWPDRPGKPKGEAISKQRLKVNYTILNRDELPRDDTTYEFEGFRYDETEVSFIWVDMPPGGVVRLHKHPYKEIFIIQEGVSTLTVGSETLEAHAGQVIIVPAETPHKFTNLSDKRLKQVDIHVNKEFITHWLEE